MSQNETEIIVPTVYGDFYISNHNSNNKDFIVARSITSYSVPVVRIHSSCMFGESLQAIDCECGAQLSAALKLISQRGGILIYAWEEGRGIGIQQKIQAIKLEQSQGIGTREAFYRLGYPPEPRDFLDHAKVLRKVHHHDQIYLATSNPLKLEAVQRLGFVVVDRISMEFEKTSQQMEYLVDKT